MRALSILALGFLALASAANAACPVPNNASRSGERGAGYHWSWNSDGYPHLVVTDSSLSAANRRAMSQLRVSCSVMEEVIMFGGDLRVVSVGHLGRSFGADVILPNVQQMYMPDKEHPFSPARWQQQAEVIRQSSAVGNISILLAELNELSPFIDNRWQITFVQKDDAGAIIRTRIKRVHAGDAHEGRITFTGDFRTIWPRTVKIMSDQLMKDATSA